MTPMVEAMPETPMMTRTAAQTRDMPLQIRAAVLQPGSWSDGDRSVDLVWSTGATVRRFDYRDWEYYDEQLSMDPAHVDLSRLNSGAPLLNTHNSDDLSSVIGVVVDGTAKVDGQQGTAKVRFSERPEVEDILRDVKAGVIRNVSVGYQVRAVEITKSDGAVPLRRAIDWMPMELSLVPVGADAGAGTRADPQCITYPCAVYLPIQSRNQENLMPPEENAAAAVEDQPAAVADVMAACRAVNLTDTFALELAARSLPINQVRAQILDHLAKGSEQHEVRGHHIQITRDAVDTRRAAIEEALLHRYAPGINKLTDLGQGYRGMSLLEMARDGLERDGIRVRGMSKNDVAALSLGLDTRSGGMLSTSDFPAILANVANKTLRRAYDESARTFQPFTRETTLPDFKPVSRTQLSGAPSLLPLNEQGEYQHGLFSDGKETYQLGTFGRVVAIDRRAIINDDLDGFTRIPFAFGQAAARMESDIVWAIITANPAMADGYNLFDGVNHGNVISGGVNSAIGIAGLGAARAAMRLQTGLAGEILNLVPAFLVAPAALETQANQYTSSNFLATKQADISYATTLTPIIEPRLDRASATKWYLIAQPGQVDTIEYAYLDGQQGVYIETRIGWEVDGLEIKAREDFAAKAIDWRGFVQSPGV